MITINKNIEYETIRCPNWYDNHRISKPVFFVNKVNQSKYIFYCKECNKKFEVIIKEPNRPCPWCLKNGVWHNCPMCEGKGFLDWVDVILNNQYEYRIKQNTGEY